MRIRFHHLLAAAALSTFAMAAQAEDIEGVIEAVDTENRTVTAQGITFQVTDDTDFDDGLNRFEDLETGQRIEVDFDYTDGQHIATEIELDD